RLDGGFRKSFPNERVHFGPIQAAVTTAERRNGNGPDSKGLDFVSERFQTLFDELNLGLPLPVLLGGEIDYVLRIDHSCWNYKHSPWLQSTLAASPLINAG